MAIAKFREAFTNRYQDILTKSLVGMKVANTRLEPTLTYGQTVHRFILDVSGVQVRDITRYADRTIDTIADDEETLTIDHEEGLAFPVDDFDKLQNGPLGFAEEAGKRVAFKMRQYIDANILAEVRNGFDTFDTGDISAADAGAGTPVVLTTTNAAQVITNIQAKLRANNVEDNGNMCLVIDPYHASVIYQTIIGKSIELAGTTLKNGYAGPLLGYSVYISNNLTAEATLTLATNPTANDTVTINGVTFKFVASPAAAGDVDLGGDAATTQANLVAAVNGAAGAGTAYIELSAANRKKLTQTLRITAGEPAANAIKFTGIGSGRLTVAKSLTAGGDGWSNNLVHCYAGKAGAIDVVMQQGVKTTFRDEPKQRTTNVLVDALYGIKTFADAKQYFLDLQMI